MFKDHSNHPGHDVECPLKIIINAHPLGTSSNGYACSWTGGHCLPSDRCKNYLLKWKEEEEE